MSEEITLEQRVKALEGAAIINANEVVKLQNIVSQFFVNTTNLGITSGLTKMTAPTPPPTSPPADTTEGRSETQV